MAGPWEKFAPAATSGAKPWDKFATGKGGTADPKATYDAALERVHQNEYPNMSDTQFADYASKVLAPSSLKDQAQGAQTFGFGDELGSAIGAVGNQARQWTGGGGPGFGEAYSDLQALEDARQKLGTEQNGPLGTAAEVVGALSTGRPDTAGSAIADALWKQMLKGGAVSTGVGAVQGFGSDNDDRMGGAIRGAEFGAAGGTLLPAVANVAGRALDTGMNAVATNRVAQQTGMDPGVARLLQETMGADGSLSPAGAARMQSAGPEAMLADAGPSARQVLDTAIQSSGRAGALARDRVGGRVSRDAQAINDALDGALGVPQGIGEMRANIAAGSAPARGSAYDAAHASPIDYSSEHGRALEQMLNERVDPGIISAANALMRRNGETSSQIMAKVADDGSVTYLKMPDVRQIDYITRALNDKAEANAGLGKLGGQTAEGASYGNLAKDMRGAARSAVPAYGAALDTAADPIRRSQAVQFGASLLDSGTTRDAVATQLTGASASERAAMAQGVRGSLDDALANVRRTMMDGDTGAREAMQALKTMSSRANREKVALVIGDDQAAQLFDELDRAANSFDLQGSLATNSKTFTRQSMNRRVNDITASEGPIASVMRGEPVNAGKRVVQALSGETPTAISQRQDQLHTAVVDALTRQGPDIVDTLEALGRFNRSRVRSSAIRDALMTRGGLLSLPAGNAVAAGTVQR